MSLPSCCKIHATSLSSHHPYPYPPSLQGFVEFRIGTQPLHLDVEMLNERLKLKGAHRMRTAMRPDEAYGMVFTWCASAAELRQMIHIRVSMLADMLSLQPATHVPFVGLVHQTSRWLCWLLPPW